MSGIDFSSEEQAALVAKIQAYVSDELDHDIGRFDAEFLLAFISKEIGVYFYNRGLLDAQAVVEARAENIADAITELEQPGGHRT